MDSDLGVLAGRGAGRQIGRPGNRVRPGRPRPKGIDMRLSLPVMLVLFSLVFFSFADLAFANNYSRGNWFCGDFRDAEQDYRADPENIYNRIGYAHCLIVNGKDSGGLAILHNIVDHSTEPARVKAAWMVANYISTGGTFENTTDEDNINEAIAAYGRVIFFISLDPNYPQDGNSLYEEEAQIELTTHYRLPLLYSDKFKKGATGTDNIHLLSSPSYNGDRDLNTYPEYSPYTIDSLEKAIEFADQCLALPLKRHFQSSSYRNYKAGCQVLKEAAQDILPLERQRLVLLDTDSCSNDLPLCSEHQEIKKEIVSIIRQAGSELRQIF